MKLSLDAPDWLYRLIYRYGYRAARVWWWFRHPHTSGANALIWHGNRVMLLRSSYRREWMAPGGAIKSDEHPIDAVLREITEGARVVRASTGSQ